MGGDGGVIAVNRKFMRAAKFGSSSSSNTKPLGNEREARSYAMRHCSASGEALRDGDIVCCEYGVLYGREGVVGQMLER